MRRSSDYLTLKESICTSAGFSDVKRIGSWLASKFASIQADGLINFEPGERRISIEELKAELLAKMVDGSFWDGCGDLDAQRSYVKGLQTFSEVADFLDGEFDRDAVFPD